MPSFKPPSFQERADLAAKAKQAALQRLRDKPPIDEAVAAERRASQHAREAAQAKLREERLAERERQKAEKKARAAETAVPEPTEAEKKAARDAKYAARKSRTGKR